MISSKQSIMRQIEEVLEAKQKREELKVIEKFRNLIELTN